MRCPRAILGSILSFCLLAGCRTSADPHAWLEEVHGQKQIAWVEKRNRDTADALASTPLFRKLHARALAILSSKGRLPRVTQRGEAFYDLWKDREHPRGIYRRTTLGELRKPTPAWETVLDIDALSKKDGTPWVFKGSLCLPPQHRRCLIKLSRGGSDAYEIRELDSKTKRFLPGGFTLAEAKSNVAWIDQDTLFVATSSGSRGVTKAGYPRLMRVWTRGTPITSAEVILEIPRSSTWVRARRWFSAGGVVDLVSERITYWRSRHYQRHEGRLVPLAIPADATIAGVYQQGLLVSVKTTWQAGGAAFREGALVYARLDALREGRGGHELVVAPAANIAVQSVAATRSAVLVTQLDHVRGRLSLFRRDARGVWAPTRVRLPGGGSIEVISASDDRDDVLVIHQGFTTPPALYHLLAGDPTPTLIAQQLATFDGARFDVEQHFAVSRDGTRVPYFQVAKKGLDHNGKNPTHIFSYGGFRVALTPSYSGSYEELSGAYGKLWLERGGVFVLANIRGGGEFGPAWHRAALKERRPRAFEDLEAVAEDLARRKVTSAPHLGIEGRSNGGLLVAATMLRRPDLYGAVVCGVPLLDMRRYHTLFAGASWVGEYGDPDRPGDWAYLRQYSPYQVLREGLPGPIPAMFMYTSTKDDRVHPGHARKMTAEMLRQRRRVYYYENLEGGHGGSSTREQLAYRVALAYSFLWKTLAPR